MTELVSVAIPTFNAAETLPMALGSLLAQSFENWEALVVDDGSTDETRKVVRRFSDSRIRYFRSETNRGRPYARGEALKEARGEYLAMLDADDWWYPTKLREQMSVLKEKSDLVLVSTGMAVTKKDGNLYGVRALGAPDQRWPQVVVMGRPTLPRVAHAPSVIRMDVAREAKFDLRLPVAQDVDFLIQVLQGNRFTVISKPLYAYAEISSEKSGGILTANKLTRYILGKYWMSHPVWIGKQISATYIKGIIYRIFFAAGLTDWVIARRSRRPSLSESQAFFSARDTVFRATERYWPGFRDQIAN